MFKQVTNFILNQLFILAVCINLFSCKSDKIEVEDGFYISGEASPFTTDLKFGQLKATVVENENNTARTGLYEIYMALEANKNFTITKVASSSLTVYGQGTGFTTVNQTATNDEMGALIHKGKYAEGGTIKVAVSGLYHIVLDEQSTNIVIMPVSKWSIIGSANSKNTAESELVLKNTFNKDTLIYELKDVDLLEGDFKFRHSGAWKQTIVENPLIKVNTNFGGTMTNLTSGGANIKIINTEIGKYTVNATWTKKSGMQFTLVKTGDIVEINYPENIYLSGSDFGAWDWSNTGVLKMIPVLNHPNAFWRIIYCNAKSEFRFSTEKTSLADFGVNGTAIVNQYGKGTQNVKISTAGYYMVYVDLKAEKISVTAPNIYLIGAAIGNLTDYAAPAGLFTVDNTAKTVTSPAALKAGNLRMYATCPLSQLDTPKAEWWQMEFMILAGKIEYRGAGGDQTAVAVTVGKKAVLNFSTGTGIIQ